MVTEGERLESISPGWAVDLDVFARQPIAPVLQRPGRDAKPRPLDLSGARSSLEGARPAVEGEQRPRLSSSRPKEKVVRFRIMNVDRDFDQAQAKHLGIEVDGLLGITGNGGDVMDAENG
jgi:hypothetical protein